MKDKKGFLLVELLVVIAILGIILTIAIPSVQNSLSMSHKKAYKLDLKSLQNAAKKYMIRKSIKMDNGSEKIITIPQMVNENIINEVKDPKTKEICDGYVTVTRNDNKYSYMPYLKCSDNYISDDYGNVNTILPIITISGSNPVSINLGDSYTDAGATAVDYQNSNITGKIITTSSVSMTVPGIYSITYSVSDDIGNEVVVKRTVNVIDNTVPTITFVPNGNTEYDRSGDTVIKVNDLGGLNNNSLKYVWTASTTEPSTVEFNLSYKSNAAVTTPSFFVSGTYYLWAMATDNQGNKAVKRSGAFNIDNIAPVITLNGPNPVTISKGNTYTDAGATATDANSGINGSVTSTGTVNPNIIGTYTITYNVSDKAGNAATPVTRTINVVDTKPPVITLNGSNPTNINVNSTYTDAGATAIDDVDGNVTSKITTTGTVNPSIIGKYTITYTVKDKANNTATSTRTINVLDNILPTVAFGTNGNSTYARTRSTTVTVSDAHTGVNITSLKYQWTISTTAPAESSFSTTFTNGGTINTPTLVTGRYYLWILAKDKAGNTLIARTNAFNLDNTKPIITMNGSATVTVNKGSTYTDAGATATDANSGINGSVTSTGTVNPSVVGTYAITYNVSDKAGNTAIPVVRTINVIDAQAPIITILGSNPININLNGTYTDAGATAVDNVDGDVTNKITTTGTVNPSVVGTYTITYTVKDNANNTATSTRIVNVLDNILPTVAFGTNGNSTYARTRSTTVTVSDNVSVNTSSLKYLWNTSAIAPVEASFNTSFTNGGTINTPTLVNGGYYLWILAKDNAGNTLIARTNVFNLDNTKPIITMNGSATVTVNMNSTYTDSGATATDNVDGTITSRIVVTNNVNTSVAGTQNVIYTVSDNAGNTATATRTVIIRIPYELCFAFEHGAIHDYHLNLYSFCTLDVVITDTFDEDLTTIADSSLTGWGFTSVTFVNLENLTMIGASAFEDNNLTSIEIPASVTYIGQSAFRANHLTSVTIPNSVKTIGNTAFEYNLITQGNAKIDNTQGNVTIGSNVFSSNGTNQNMTITPIYLR